jgi:hypothetical protein
MFLVVFTGSDTVALRPIVFLILRRYGLWAMAGGDGGRGLAFFFFIPVDIFAVE